MRARVRALAARLRRGPAGLVLGYHVIDDRPGDRESDLIPPIALADFERQLDHLAAHYRVVALAELRDEIAGMRRGDPPPVAITFDDDDRQHLDRAAPALAARGMPATYFVCGTAIEGPRSAWWQRLQRAWDRRAYAEAAACLPEAARGSLPADPDLHALGAAIEALTPAERDRVSECLIGPAGPDPEGENLDADGIAALAGQGFEIGFHTRRHDRLVDLDDEQLGQAMTRGRDELERIAGRRPTAIAYPHNRADDRVAEAARAAGFELGLTGTGKPVTAETDPLLIGRCDPIYFDPSPDGFADTLAGILTR